MDLPRWPKLRECIHLFVILQTFSFPSSSSPASAPSTNPCKFNTDPEKNHFEALQPLVGQTFHAQYRLQPDPQVPGQKEQTYDFYIGICTSVCPNIKFDVDGHKCDGTEGVVQTWRDERGKQETRVVGRFEEVMIQGSDRWKMMTYKSGDKYHHHCHLESERKANLMFTCDETLSAPVVHVLEENSQRNDSCYYLIEIASNVLCPKLSTILPQGVSAGSVIVILLVVAVSCYLFFGFLYNRIVLGAKGIDQVPNLPFWQNLGNLMADGCDFAFRTKTATLTNTRSNPGSGGGYEPVTASPGERVYKGLGDDILSNADTNAADDSLLPM